MSGYEPQEEEITLGANEKTTLDVDMKKRPAGTSSNPDMGFLSSISDARIFLEKLYKSTNNPSEPWQSYFNVIFVPCQAQWLYVIIIKQLIKED